jgi:hypothetical protein
MANHGAIGGAMGDAAGYAGDGMQAAGGYATLARPIKI